MGKEQESGFKKQQHFFNAFKNGAAFNPALMDSKEPTLKDPKEESTLTDLEEESSLKDSDSGEESTLKDPAEECSTLKYLESLEGKGTKVFV